MARLRTSTATSAGGIVVRYESGQPWLVVGSRRRERDGRTWTLPKGTPEPGRDAASRPPSARSSEETGLEVRITGPLDSIEYWFVQSGTRIHKTVHYFLMEPVGGELADHDHEFDEVRWIPFETRRHDADLRDRARALVREEGRARPVLTRSRPRPAPRRDRPRDRCRDPAVHLTPLTDAHRALGARLIEFGGWLMPVQYGSILEEHRTVRDGSGCSTSRTWASSTSRGRKPARRSPAALVSDPPSLAVGRAQYSMICAPDGGIIDDLIVYRLGETRFLVVANAGNAADRVGRAGRAARRRSPPSSTTGRSRPACSRSRVRAAVDVLAPLTDVDLAALRYYAAAEGTVAGIAGLVARTGYTGEDGFEVFVDTDRTRRAVGGAARRRCGAHDGGCRSASGRATRSGWRPGCRSTATSSTSRRTRTRRASAGSSSSASPATSSVARRSRRSPATGPTRRLVGLSSRAAGSPGTATRSASGDRRTGVVTSGTQSPTLGVPIAMAYVAPADAEPGTVVDVEIRDARVPARVVDLAVLQEGQPEPMVPTDLRYTKDHEWVRIDGDEATIGITAYAADQLGDIVFVELPERGSGRSTQAATFGVVESVKAVSDLFAPVSGEVDRDERRARREPGARQQRPVRRRLDDPAHASPTRPSSTPCSTLTPTTP